MMMLYGVYVCARCLITKRLHLNFHLGMLVIYFTIIRFYCKLEIKSFCKKAFTGIDPKVKMYRYRKS